MYKYRFPIGAWSGDGHGKCDWFVARGEKPVEDLREAHFKCKEVLGFNIEDICCDYEEYNIEKELRAKIVATGIVKDDYLVDFGQKVLFNLWLKILNHIDPDLKLESAEEVIPSITFYGKDAQERHLCGPGYGLFS